jgi:hypothetical protein
MTDEEAEAWAEAVTELLREEIQLSYSKPTERT